MSYLGGAGLGGEDVPPPSGDLVRPFIVTGGRTRPSRTDIRVESLLEASADAVGATPEEGAVLLVARTGTLSVAEISAHTGLPIGVVTVLAADLLDAGAVKLHQTDPVDIEVSALNRMIERVRAL